MLVSRVVNSELVNFMRKAKATLHAGACLWPFYMRPFRPLFHSMMVVGLILYALVYSVLLDVSLLRLCIGLTWIMCRGLSIASLSIIL